MAGIFKIPAISLSNIFIRVIIMENFENTNVETNEEKKPETNWKTELWEWVKTIVIAVVIALLLKTFVMTLAKVDGQSMEPTLQHADRMYVNKLFYTPERGDVVIVETGDPYAPFYIKRVIATDGDTLFIDFETSDVYVNGEIIDEPYIAEPTRRAGGYINKLIAKGKYSLENPIEIGKDQVFVMGDNRNNSKDSREIGPVAVDDITGHAVFRFWPLDNMGNTDHSFKD